VKTRRRRRWPWVVGIAAGALGVLLVPVALVVVPILTHADQGQANQDPAAEEWPAVVTATGDDGRERSLELFPAEPGGSVDSSALVAGQRLVVAGSGYDPSRGVYLAICRIPDSPAERPTPCLGGMPDAEEGEEGASGDVQWAASNWINDDWAWKLFGARPFDDRETGTFTAYLLVPEPTEEALDCRVEACAVYSRNDHTASSDRVQDLGIPVAFAD